MKTKKCPVCIIAVKGSMKQHLIDDIQDAENMEIEAWEIQNEAKKAYKKLTRKDYETK